MVWKDRLYQYKYWIGTTLNYTQTYSYDNAGNVTSISDSRGSAYSSEYAWEGRTLTGVSLGGSTTDIAYAYNQNGIRIEKTVNGTVTTQYLVDGSRVLYESNGTNTLYYTYDVDGSLISFNYNGTDYFYVYNALGDIVKLLNVSRQVVVEYRYDAFGNILFQTTGTLASANPYRYRGYRYDEETKLYYLNSRYYNPQTGRFLNADGLLQGSQTTLGFNLFAYVENNPVVNVDPSGYCLADANGDGMNPSHRPKCSSSNDQRWDQYVYGEKYSLSNYSKISEISVYYDPDFEWYEYAIITLSIFGVGYLAKEPIVTVLLLLLELEIIAFDEFIMRPVYIHVTYYENKKSGMSALVVGFSHAIEKHDSPFDTGMFYYYDITYFNQLQKMAIRDLEPIADDYKTWE